MRVVSTILGIVSLLGAVSCTADAISPSGEVVASVSSALAWSLTNDQRRAYLYYYAPIIFKSADEGQSINFGFDWMTNFDFERDGQFKNNKANWEKVDEFVANSSDPRFATWQLRPTMYSAAIEYMEGSSKSLTLLYHPYHAKEEKSIHDWERIEIRINNVTGTPGGAGESPRYAGITAHDTTLSQLYGHHDLNWMPTASGLHPMIWRAEHKDKISGFDKNEMHFVENTWSTINLWNNASSVNNEVDVTQSSEQKQFQYIFVPEGDSAAVSYWNAQTLSLSNANALAAKTDGYYPSWAYTKRIKYELQDLADILPTHADCASCGGAACATENGWSTYSQHWKAGEVYNLRLFNPITSEAGPTLVSASSVCSSNRTRFVLTSIDTEDSAEERKGYPYKGWFWGAYRQNSEQEGGPAFAGTSFRSATTGAALVRPCTGGLNLYWCQYDYLAHDGPVGYSSNGYFYEYATWLPTGWHLAANGGFDGRWTQLFDDNHGPASVPPGGGGGGYEPPPDGCGGCPLNRYCDEACGMCLMLGQICP